MISDPKALQYMLHKSGYNFEKSVQARIVTFLIMGRSIIWAPSLL